MYSLLKSAASAVLKLMSAVIAIAHVLFVSMKSLSVSTMLLEYSFGKLKYDSTTLPMSGFLGSSPVSASKFPVSLAILNFFIIKFSVWEFEKFENSDVRKTTEKYWLGRDGEKHAKLCLDASQSS